MTALGTDAPDAAGLVYIAALGIDEGESLGGLLSQGPVTPTLAASASAFGDVMGVPAWKSRPPAEPPVADSPVAR